MNNIFPQKNSKDFTIKIFQIITHFFKDNQMAYYQPQQPVYQMNQMNQMNCNNKSISNINGIQVEIENNPSFNAGRQAVYINGKLIQINEPITSIKIINTKSC